MSGRTDFSRERIMRRRTPNKRDKKREREKEKNIEDKNDENNVKVIKHELIEPFDYMITLQKQINKKFDSNWKNRSYEEYQIAMLMKVSNLIDINGWKWWNKEETGDMNAFMIRLIELYQFIISIYIKDKKNISTESVRPISVDNNVLMSMINYILSDDINSLYNTVKGIFVEKRINPLILNTTCLISRYIRSLDGYITGEYTSLGYVDDDIELMEYCLKNNEDTLENIIENIYKFHNIPKEERLIIKK